MATFADKWCIAFGLSSTPGTENIIHKLTHKHQNSGIFTILILFITVYRFRPIRLGYGPLVHEMIWIINTYVEREVRTQEFWCRHPAWPLIYILKLSTYINNYMNGYAGCRHHKSWVRTSRSRNGLINSFTEREVSFTQEFWCRHPAWSLIYISQLSTYINIVLGTDLSLSKWFD